MRVEVAFANFANEDTQTVIGVTLPARATAREAIRKSGVLTLHPEIDLAQNRVGVFGRLVELDQVLCEHDRVEIYRPLRVSAAEARRLRARKQTRRR